VLTDSDKVFIIEILSTFVIKQAIFTRKQNVLSLSLQLLFPGLRKIYLGAFAVATLQSAGKTY